ncbi:META domain-containing protein [Agromyces italicus]|uniref:META domain-containing protein n=1 Tax=Agromyces italicus TaxID=279572 RepID=UPI0003FFAD7F|nr:META domain-containing protein [Agromyces italicus]
MSTSSIDRRSARAGLAGSVAVVTLVLTAACTSTGTSNTPPASVPATTPSPFPVSMSPVGAWGDTNDATVPSLSLAADGTLSGTDGCNRLIGRWEDEGGGRIEFDDVASTRMACGGVDTWLSALDEATIDGDTMTVLGDDDVVIGTLERTG